VRLPWPDEEVQTRIREHFGDTGWMQFTYDGPRPWTGPLGDLQVTIVDSSGQPAAVYCLLGTTDPRVQAERFDFVEDGKCFYQDLPAVVWSLRIDQESRTEEATVFKDFAVPPGGVERATVVIGGAE
jgi:hypothetical protein